MRKTVEVMYGIFHTTRMFILIELKIEDSFKTTLTYK